MRKYRLHYVGSALLATWFTSLSAVANEDSNIWMVTNLTKQINEKLSVNMEGQWRFVDDGSAFGQRLLRPSATYKLNDTFSLTAGYVHVLTNPRNRESFDENRPWQQLGYKLFKNDYGVSFRGRSRIEQRFVETGDDLGWRYRQYFRLDVPVERQSATRLVWWNEMFFELNNTDWGQRDELDQTRNFVGVSFPALDYLRVETGYLNQYINRVDRNIQNHTFASYLNFRF